MKARRARLITVAGPGGRHDVVAAADASLVFLLPVIVDLVGGDEWPRNSPRWALRTEDGRVLAATRSLAACGVRDGQVLLLSGISLNDAPHTEEQG